jgi:hypothetical protein
MNIIEEQTMNDENNPDVTGNMDAPTRAPSAKKVYSKPTLVVLSQSHATNNKFSLLPIERPGTTTFGPS